MVDPCLFILTINTLTHAYMADHSSVISDLAVGDKVCVIELLTDDWMQVHWSTSNIGHTGYLHQITVHKPTKPTAPIPYEAQDAPREVDTPPVSPITKPDVPPPPPPPNPPPPKNETLPEAPPVHQWAPPPAVHPTMPPLPPAKRDSSRYEEDPRPPKPRAAREIVMRLDPLPQSQRNQDEPRVPHVLTMGCVSGYPSYTARYVNGTNMLQVTGGGHVHQYQVIDYRDKHSAHVLYVSAKGEGQNRTLYFAFDYSMSDSDVSAARAKGPGYDSRDKCSMNWGDTYAD